MSRVLIAVMLALATSTAVAQDRRPIPYPVDLPRDFQRAVDRGTRTLTGEPGSGYWQQWTDYTLHARIDAAEQRLDGRATIVYHNRSPDTLRMVALHLLQNLHAEGVMRSEPAEVTGGVELTRVVVSGRILEPLIGPMGPGYQVDGTILGVRLPSPLAPSGSLRMEIDWTFEIPQAGAGGRMGWSEDNLFFLAYWYPQMAVYDDVVGWHVDQFLGNAEFHMGFGNYRYTVDAPEGWVVRGTGRLLNADEVLPAEIRSRMARAEQSDTVVHVLTPADFGAGRATTRAANGRLTWRFAADSVRDVAFSATSAYRWDAARTPAGDLNGDGRTDYARVDALWRESAPRWANVWRYSQHSIDFLSRWTGIPYPWPHMTAVEGGGIIGGGMEFPMMTIMGDYNLRGDSALYYVTAHELAHMWVPMIVATDEKRHSWMDEGMTTFKENQARNEFFPGINHDHPDRDQYLSVARAGLEGPIMRRSDYHYPGPAYGVASYPKPATLLATLRALLGEDAFVQAYRTFLSEWAFKHPKPHDMFHTFNRVSGRNLDWFWRSWYYETWVLDHAVAEVTPVRDGTRIIVEDRGRAILPARLTITRENGEQLRREVPAETWLSGATRAEVFVPGGSPVVRVEIDAAQEFPDVDRTNDVWIRR